MILDRLYYSMVCVGLGELEKRIKGEIVQNVSVSKWYHGLNI